VKEVRIVKSMGKLKKVGIGIGIVIAAFFVLVIAVGVSSQHRENELKETEKIATLTPEEVKAKSIEITYDDLMRNNEDHVGKIVHYQGKIIQVQNVYGDTYVLRVGTSDAPYYFGDIIWVNYAGKRVLEGDIIEFWGKVKGLKDYTAVLGNSVTIPEIDASILDVVKKQGNTEAKTETKTNSVSKTELRNVTAHPLIPVINEESAYTITFAISTELVDVKSEEITFPDGFNVSNAKMVNIEAAQSGFPIGKLTASGQTLIWNHDIAYRPACCLLVKMTIADIVNGHTLDNQISIVTKDRNDVIIDGPSTATFQLSG
jgi:hypothetical protein